MSRLWSQFGCGFERWGQSRFRHRGRSRFGHWFRHRGWSGLRCQFGSRGWSWFGCRFGCRVSVLELVRESAWALIWESGQELAPESARVWVQASGPESVRA